MHGLHGMSRHRARCAARMQLHAADAALRILLVVEVEWTFDSTSSRCGTYMHACMLCIAVQLWRSKHLIKFDSKRPVSDVQTPDHDRPNPGRFAHSHAHTCAEACSKSFSREGSEIHTDVWWETCCDHASSIEIGYLPSKHLSRDSGSGQQKRSQQCRAVH